MTMKGLGSNRAREMDYQHQSRTFSAPATHTHVGIKSSNPPEQDPQLYHKADKR